MPKLPPKPSENAGNAASAPEATKPRCGKGSNFHGKAGRSGPPVGSSNAARHYMLGGKLPDRLAYIENRLNAFRRHLEAQVMEKRGEISVTDAACINSALKWERHGALAQNWLRKEAEKLSASERLRFSEAIAKASDMRDKNLRMLKLDAPPPPAWAGLNEIDVKGDEL